MNFQAASGFFELVLMYSGWSPTVPLPGFPSAEGKLGNTHLFGF